MSTSSQKPSFQFGQVQQKGPLIAENTSLPVGKLYFNFRTKESSIPTRQLNFQPRIQEKKAFRWAKRFFPLLFDLCSKAFLVNF